MNPAEQKYYQHSLELSSPKRGRRRRIQGSRLPHEELSIKEEPLEPDVLATVGPSGSQPAGGHMLLPMGLHQQDLSNLATVAAAAGTPLTAAISSTLFLWPLLNHSNPCPSTCMYELLFASSRAYLVV
ncbi:hypothetical protein GBAR_LOCUS6057 [Geodia barretti]|uniref:Uncharacterized protein n=1 Tax=Geodia barretti TaxID=519541 RepID=A0AA35RCF3_GEOBA|nr:hypothetical protein GBAR_LOCUS6057 [Geodia barretti]